VLVGERDGAYRRGRKSRCGTGAEEAVVVGEERMGEGVLPPASVEKRGGGRLAEQGDTHDISATDLLMKERRGGHR
jgi:hypothetical protein